MTHSPKDLSTLVARIYDCAGEQDDWAPMLAELARFMRADRSLLFSSRRGRARAASVDYAGYYHDCDVLSQTAEQQSRFRAGS